MSELDKWLSSLQYLPCFMRDFHDQKDIFKSIEYLYQDNENFDKIPYWVSSHIYTVDFFLWYMASRGYTLQKSRKNIEFKDHFSIKELESESMKRLFNPK